MNKTFDFSPNTLIGHWHVIRIIIDKFSLMNNSSYEQIFLQDSDLFTGAIYALSGNAHFTPFHNVAFPHCSTPILRYEEKLTHMTQQIRAEQTYHYRFAQNQLCIDFPNNRFNESPKLANLEPFDISKPNNLGTPFCQFNLNQSSPSQKMIALPHICGQDQYDVVLIAGMNSDLIELIENALYKLPPYLTSKKNINNSPLVDSAITQIKSLRSNENTHSFMKDVLVKGPNKAYRAISLLLKLA